MYCAAYLRSLVPGQSYLELCRLADAEQLESGLRFARVTRAKGVGVGFCVGDTGAWERHEWGSDLVVSIGEVSFS